jgi:hypothetical protein
VSSGRTVRHDAKREQQLSLRAFEVAADRGLDGREIAFSGQARGL